ncbi:GerAB/ArcD/ProY family transporter [Paenibacillus puerhi]|uniref:GerAB/ArcD/ProY family transporter n=1 Tax=Paenibacillus puerhi TaxID=2692622 RepID=UPI001358F478|nr:endospore germination permease [Paenibacillus puerhi]
MQQPVQIGIRQFQIVVILFTIGTTILITPAGLASEAKQDAWMAPLFAMVPGLLLVLLYSRIGRGDQGMTLVRLCEALLGTWLGKAWSIFFIFFSFLASAMVMFDVGRFITSIIMPETPLAFINALFVFLLIYATGVGFDALARMLELFFPWFVLLFLLMVIILSPQIDFRNAQPVLEAAPNKLLSATLSVLSITFMPLVVFLMVYPSRLKDPESAKHAFFTAALIGNALSSVIIALTIFVLGANLTSLQEYPVYHLAKKISIGNFIERIEAVVAGLWLITSFAKMSLYFYAALSGFVDVAKLKSQRSVLVPMGVLLLVVSVDIFPDSAFEKKFNATDWIAFVLCVGVILPLILVATKYWRGRYGKQSAK